MENKKVIDVVRIESFKPSIIHFNTKIGKMAFEMLLERENNQLLYFVSDIEDKSTLKDGDWVYWKNGDFQGVEQIKNGSRPKTMTLKKIEASNDLDLNVPLIPDKFLLEYIVAFNDGKPIEHIEDEPTPNNEPVFTLSQIKEKLENLKQPTNWDPEYSPSELIRNREFNSQIDFWFETYFIK